MQNPNHQSNSPSKQSGRPPQDLQTRLHRAAEALQKADCVLLGGGAGLSAAAGLTYSGPRFTGNFTDFIEKYGLTDMYSSAFYPFKTPGELWAYWARHIHLNRHAPGPTPLYQTLGGLVAGKDHFVITTNVDHQFHKAGFAPAGVWMVQGDYGFLQCATPCHGGLYYNEKEVAEMLAATRGCKIPTGLVPHCPRCGGPMKVHVHSDSSFIQGEAWHRGEAAFAAFLQKARGKRLLLLELGVGFNTPGIIRYPFEQITRQNPGATLVRLNRDAPGGPPENAGRTIAFAEDMNEILPAIAALAHAPGKGESP